MISRIFIQIIIFILFISHSPIYSQSVIDSLKKVIADVEAICGDEPCDADTGRINAYLIFGYEFYMQDPDSAIALWKKSEKIALRCFPLPFVQPEIR